MPLRNLLYPVEAKKVKPGNDMLEKPCKGALRRDKTGKKSTVAIGGKVPVP